MTTKRIAIDIRSIQRTVHTGVEQYLTSLLTAWRTAGKNEMFRLYANQIRPLETTDATRDYSVRHYRIPNKILNASLSFFGEPRTHRFAHEKVLFLPNQNFLRVDTSIRLVMFVHDLSFIRFPHFFSRKGRLWHRLVRIKSLLKRADALITGSQFTADELLSVFPHETNGKVVKIPLGVDQVYFGKNASVNDTLTSGAVIPESYILYVGTIEPRKNLETLIDAFNLLAKERSSLSLVIAGKAGWKSQQIFRAIKKSAVSKRIHYVGYITLEDKLRLMKRASVFVFPSWYEGFGFPPLEAMAAGCPVVVSSTSALPEVVSDAGILIQPYQTGDFIHAVKNILDDSHLREDLIERGQKRAELFSWKTTAEKTLNVLERYI